MKRVPPSALVIEPDGLLRAIIRSTLGLIGFDPVLTAADGEDGRDLANAVAPDLAIIALDAPPEPGAGLIFALRDTVGAVDPLIPIIAVGDFRSEAEVLAARDAGAHELLARPLTIAALFERVEEVVMRPRPFIICSTYFGPDRRRAARSFDGPERRLAAPPEPVPDPHAVDPHARFAKQMRKRMAGEA